MNTQKTACVVVTYNRLNLLKECIEALKKQTAALWRIYIVDNHSTDGTGEYLLTLSEENIKVLSLPANIGGSGGFAKGIETAVKDGADWLWIMDDDSIPSSNALERLLAARNQTPRVGFLASKVVWTDGSVHKMNVTHIIGNSRKDNISFNEYSSPECPAFRVSFASFVSILIKANIVKEIGLPYSEFFIWMDDSEYTSRIIKAGYDGLYIDNSIVLHKTPTNYTSELSTAPVGSAWKFYYEARNMVFMKRLMKKKKGIALWISTMNYYRRSCKKIKGRGEEAREFKKNLWKGCCDGMSFMPTIKYIDKD